MAQLDQVKYNLAAATLTAPFDGMVAAVNVNVGELASPAAPIPLLSLVDPSNLRLDASVDETDVSHVQRGQDVTVAFDAVPGKTFQGKVLSIAPNATVQSGVASYIVSISVESSPEIKPGMTGNADIIYAHHDDALLVPSRAVRTDGDNRLVSVLEGGQVVAKTVVVGVSDDKSTEIVSGIQPGDQVVLPSTSTVAPAFANGGVRR
jgi:HlyD family secretion protein